jgi:signal transduction histidine kinase
MWNTDPISGAESIDGAITFMSTRSDPSFSPDEIAFAELVTRSCGRALRNSRLFESLNQRRLTAERESRSTSDMLGHVTHELRTPLAAIGGYAELMELGVRGSVNDAQLHDLQRIRWNQQHLLSLITQILSFVRVDTGRTEFVRADFELGTVIRESSEMLEPLIAEKHQLLRLEGCDERGIIGEGDPHKVRQIAINLITNALKYSPPNTDIVVRCGAAGSAVFVDFTDVGPGIAPDKHEAIFLPFVQLPGGTADRRGGVGLGLAIARQLARGMNGDLTVDSMEGRGSTFRLSLPAGGRARRRDDAPV